MRRPDAVDALAAVAGDFSPRARREKLRLLREVEASPLRAPRALHRLHEILCFLQAYPDDPAVLAAVNRGLDDFPTRVERLGPAAARRLDDTGIAGTSIEYPFGLPMTRWLACRFPADVRIAWERFDGVEKLRDVLALMVHVSEDDAFGEFGLDWRRWFEIARGGRALDDLQVLLELFEGAPLEGDGREWLFETLALPIAWRLAGPASRTLARLPGERPVFGPIVGRMAGHPREPGIAREIRRPVTLRRAPRPLALALIDAARTALATRLRELHAISHANPDDVLVADPGQGLRIALIGVRPESRLPIEAFYAYLVLRNGVPIGYGGTWHLFETLWFGVNIFESFRRGESAWVVAQALRALYRALGMRGIALEPFQVGAGNEEALRSGAFYFYHRLGFRPRDPAVRALFEREQAKIAHDRGYRSPISVLRRLARAELYLPLFPAGRQPPRLPRAGDLAGLVTGHIARRFAGDRATAVREDVRRVARTLGATDRTRWPATEQRAFERLALLVAVIPDLQAWPASDRRALVGVLRAKGSRSETHYARAFDAHARFRASLEALLPSIRRPPG